MVDDGSRERLSEMRMGLLDSCPGNVQRGEESNEVSEKDWVWGACVGWLEANG